MINGAHIVIYSRDAEADRALFRDVLDFKYVDVGHGWLIFELPPAELAIHPSDENDRHELFLMCDDVYAAVKALSARGVSCEPFSAQRWGKSTRFALPGGGSVGLYEPRHARP
jgi:catechol 2,3-dioxygenase-like lactoylglutathione lyase family enzyme